nr:hypothetical protein [Tanacetum cinerariifolium]
MLAPSGVGLILYQPYGNLYAMTEQAANLSTYNTEPSRCFNFIYDDDDDDDYEQSTIRLNEIDSQIPSSIAIAPVLPTMEPEDSLIMRDEDLSIIPENESDEFINSSVENLVSIPSESEDTSDTECDLPFYGNCMTFSNPLFDSNDDFTSSDDESLFDEDVLEDNNIENKDSYDSNLDEPDLLVTPLLDANKDECFDPGDDIDEIELLLHRDPSTLKISVVVKDKQEKDKIGTKPNKNEKRGKSQQCQSPITVKKAEKEKKIQS